MTASSRGRAAGAAPAMLAIAMLAIGLGGCPGDTPPPGGADAPRAPDARLGPPPVDAVRGPDASPGAPDAGPGAPDASPGAPDAGDCACEPNELCCGGECVVPCGTPRTCDCWCYPDMICCSCPGAGCGTGWGCQLSAGSPCAC